MEEAEGEAVDVGDDEADGEAEGEAVGAAVRGPMVSRVVLAGLVRSVVFSEPVRTGAS